MSWSDAEENRIQAIETMLNNLQVAVNNVVSKLQMRQLLLVKQAEIDSLTQRVESLETQVTNLQNTLE